MSKNRFIGNYLKLSTDRYPAPAERVVDMSTLSGGLNLWELEYKLDADQSPDMENMMWNEGALSSRGGQSHLYNPEAAGHTSDNYGSFYACYDREWGNLTNRVIVHKGTSLYTVDVTSYGEGTSPGRHVQLRSGLAEQKGLFFVFGEYLYYMNGVQYIRIDTDGLVTDVVPYIPTVVVNRKPDGSGGQTYQPENRIASGKEIRFTADGTSTVYYLPYKELEETPVEATGQIILSGTWSDVTFQECEKYSTRDAFPATGKTGIVYIATDTAKQYKWVNSNYSEITDPSEVLQAYQIFIVSRTEGTVTFDVAPTNTTSATPNNVQIICYKGDNAQKQSIYTCRSVTTYGAENAIAVVFGGPTAQPNAYFWSGNDSTGVRADYFPYEYYNLAGNADEFITGFGKQQGMLVIFKEHSIGKSEPSQSNISERTYVSLPYVPINDKIGCNVPGSIRLVNNNLLFANTYGGVYLLLDSTAAGENNVVRISRNINGSGTKGLLYDLRQNPGACTSIDDDQRYWLVCNNHAYLWDYSVRAYNTYYGTKEETLSWFYLTNILAKGWIVTDTNKYYFKSNGGLVTFTDSFVDFPDVLDPETSEPYPFPRRYTFATQYFGTYEALKDVTKVIIAVRSSTNAYMTVSYETDWENRLDNSARDDNTEVEAYSYSITPRDLSYRNLEVQRFAAVALRTPRCFHIKHFSLKVANDKINTDMTIVHAQIFYRYSRRER